VRELGGAHLVFDVNEVLGALDGCEIGLLREQKEGGLYGKWLINRRREE
jgi:hypothetical protein